MSQGFVQLAADSTGKKIDTQITTTAAQHRQVMVIGAKDTDANVAPVDATKGLAVDLTATGTNTNKLLVTPDSIALPNHQSTNIDQIGGSSLSLGTQAAANSVPVALPTATITTLTPPSNAGYALDASLSTIDTDIKANVTLHAGANIIGKTTTDQTTHGTTDLVAADITKVAGTAISGTNGLPSTITDNTNTANVVAGDTGFNSIVTASGTKTMTFTTSSSGVQTILANTLCEGYTWIEVVYTSVGAGLALTGQFSTASGGTYVNSSSFGSGGTTASTSALGTTVNTIYSGPIRGNYFQIAVSALTSGTFTGTVTLRATPPFSGGVVATQTGTWTVGSNSAAGSAVPANAFYMGLNDGTNMVGFKDYIAALAGTGLGVGAVATVGGLMPIGTALNTYSVHLTTNATTTPTASTAYISSISISNEVGGTTSTVTIQDKQGTPLKLVNGLATTALTTAPTVINFQTPVKMVSGIDVITAGAVAATIDVWINYYQ